MINLTRRSIVATESATKSVQRSTAATRKATTALRDLIRDEKHESGKAEQPAASRKNDQAKTRR